MMVSAVRLAVRGWWGARRGMLDSIPQPNDLPRASAPGPEPGRVLLIGNGPVAGLGVTSHELALPGHLARQIAALTQRGVELQLIEHKDLTIGNAARYFRDESTDDYDLIVCMVGSPDAVYLTTVDEWHDHLSRLLGHFVHSAPRAGILAVGIPPTSALRLVPGVAAAVIDARVIELNEVTLDATSLWAGADYLPFSPPAEPDGDRHRSAATYGRWAALIAPHAARLLEDAAVARAALPGQSGDQARVENAASSALADGS